MKLKVLHAPNSRLIFNQLSGDLSSWQGVLGKIDNYIRNESRLEIANPYAFIYFLPEEQIWVGREVIGPRQENGPLMIDFEAGEIFSYQHANSLELDENQLVDLKNRICQENVGEIDVNSPWRLRIDLEKEDEIFVYFEFFAKNYPFPKLTN
jgi:hypothetical protein